MIIKLEWLVAVGVKKDQAEGWLEFLQPVCDSFKITANNNRIAMFLAQCAHESLGFSVLEENLNYSAQRLMAVWPRMFKTLDIAEQYQHNPEKLANFVYSERNGNGDVDSGDGWRYRGRGLIQTTGRANYNTAQSRTSIECVKYPELLIVHQYAAKVSAAHWALEGYNALADAGNFDLITRRINGGMTGNEDRHRRLYAIQEAMKA